MDLTKPGVVQETQADIGVSMVQFNMMVYLENEDNMSR